MTVAEPVVLTTTEELDAQLQGDRPVLMLLWRDRPPQQTVEMALKEVAEKHGQQVQVLKVDAREDPALAERFDLGQAPVLIGWYEGEERLRRAKPWNSDVAFMAQDLLAMAPSPEPAAEDGAAVEDRPIHVTEQTFQEKVINSPLPVLVDFWAEWCGPCKMVAPILERLAREFAGKVRIAKVDVDQNPRLAAQFGVQGIPTLMFVKNGRIVGQSAGAAPEPALRDALNKLIAWPV